MMRPCLALEGMGRRLWPVFSGVLVVEAQKRLYQGLPLPSARRAVFSFRFLRRKEHLSAGCGKYRQEPARQIVKLVWRRISDSNAN